MQQKAQAGIKPLAPAMRAELQISHFSSLFVHPVVGTRCTWHAGPSYVFLIYRLSTHCLQK